MRVTKLFLILTLLCAVAQEAWAQASWAEVYAMTNTAAANWTQLNAGSTTGMTLGAANTTTYYYANSNLSFTNSSVGGSGLTIQGVVYLYLPEGVTITCKGANAGQPTGAGAGIELAEGNALYLIGQGAVNATGGNAAGGANGANGSDAGWNNQNYWSGTGGAGGDGGGGAGAGIGTRGGDGGQGGAGAASVSSSWSHAGGGSGAGGNAGATAGAMGNLYVTPSFVNPTATGGAAANTSGSAGSAGKSILDDDQTYNYCAAGGGGGGAGGFGGAASNIGTGGPGGGGGGGGAAGNLEWCNTGYYVVSAPGGKGGQNSDTSRADDGAESILNYNAINNGMVVSNSSGWSNNDNYISSQAVGSGGTGGEAGNASKALWPSSGEGTVDSPYLISNEYDWNTFAHNVSNGTGYSGQYVKMTSDISVTTMAGGSETNGFRGTFDGDGHTLTFNMSGQTEKFIAPFRCVGGIAIIKNIKTAGSISASNMYATGLIASIEDGSTVNVENCRSSMAINNSGSGEMTISGLVGRLEDANLTIGGCVFDGSLAGRSAVGNAGFVSWIAPHSNVTIKDCIFAPGSISTSTDKCATFARKDEDESATVTLTNCYYTKAYGTAQGTEVYFITASAPSDIGNLVRDYGMVKAYQNGLIFNSLCYANFSTGIGSEYIPYLIDSEDALAKIASMVNSGVTDFCNKYFSLICDLDLSGRDWTPIGTKDRPFRGNFNGNNHIISNMTVNNPSGDYNGLFGWVEGKINDPAQYAPIQGSDYIRNLVVKNANVLGYYYTGGVAGRVHGEVTFENIILDGGTVSGNDYTGGLIGSAEGEYRDLGVNEAISYLHVNNCLFINGEVTEHTIQHDELLNQYERTSFVMFGNIERHSYFNNSYFAEINGAHEDHYNVRAYPIIRNLPSNVSCDFHNTSGIMYDGKYYVPNTTAHFNLHCADLSQVITSVKVNGSVIGTSSGVYEIAIDGSQAQAYTISAETAATGITGSGDSEEDPILIKNADAWNLFANTVNNGYNFKGKFVKLVADISVSTMVGSSNANSFQGTFMGDSIHTMTFTQGSAESPFSEQYCAPFRYVNAATIRDLWVAGDIYTSNQYGAGLVGRSDSETNIRNCLVGTVVHSSVNGDGSHGGIVANPHDVLHINGCAYIGRLLTTNGTTNCGGFVGWTNYNLSINYSLYAPFAIIPEGETAINNGATFARYNRVFSTSHIYHTETMGDYQGFRVSLFDDAPANLGGMETDYGTVQGYSNGIICDGSYYVMPDTINLANNADNSPIISNANGYAAYVTLADRTLYKNGSWNTLCLPFDVTLSGSPLEGAVARPLTDAGIEGSALNLTFGDEVTTLVAGTPYIIKWESGDDLVNPVFSDVIIDASDNSYDNHAAGNTRVRFLGTYNSRTFNSEDKSILLMGNENSLYYPITGASIGAQHAYFKIGDDGAAPARITLFNINFGKGDITTGITDVTTDARSGADGWYTIDGRRLAGKPTQSGIYINNGKKILIQIR